MKPILSMALKDLRLLTLDRGGLFFIFFFPLLYAIFFGYITAAMSGGGGDDDVVPSVRVALVDEDQTETSKSFADLLIAAPELDVLTVEERSAGATLVQEGKRAALLVIPDGFGARGQSFFMGEPPRIQIAADPARTAERGMLEGILQKYGAERMQESFTDPEVMRANAQQALATLQNDAETPPLVRAALQGFLGSVNLLADELAAADVTEEDIEESPAGAGFQPLIVETIPLFPRDEDEEPKTNAFSISFPQGILWGIMGAAAGFGISLVTERTHGTMTRLRMAPIRQSQILGGKALACFLTTISVAATLLVIGRIAFNVTPTSILWLIVAVTCVAICFVGIMMLLSVLGRTEASASGIGWAALIVMAMIGGGMIPLMFIQRISLLNALSNLSPVKWAILAIEGAVWRGFSPQQMLVPCAVLVVIGVGTFLAGAALFRTLERD